MQGTVSQTVCSCQTLRQRISSGHFSQHNRQAPKRRWLVQQPQSPQEPHEPHEPHDPQELHEPQLLAEQEPHEPHEPQSPQEPQALLASQPQLDVQALQDPQEPHDDPQEPHDDPHEPHELQVLHELHAQQAAHSWTR